MRTCARLLRAGWGAGERVRSVAGLVPRRRSGHILARANRAHGEQAPKPGNRARARGVTARRTALAYGSQSKVTHYRLYGPDGPASLLSTCRYSAIAGTAQSPRTGPGNRELTAPGRRSTYLRRIPADPAKRNGRPRVGPLALPRPATFRSADARHRRTWHLPWTCIGPGGWLTSLIASQALLR